MEVALLTREIDQIAKDKGLDRQTIVGAIEEAMRQAAKKKYGLEKEIAARFNPESGEVELFEFREVVEEVSDAENHIALAQARELDPEVELGDEIGIKMDTEGFYGRIIASAVRNVIIQLVRDAERDIVYQEFKDREGTVVSGIARRYERGALIVDLGHAEAVLPAKEQISRENYRPGDRLRAFVLEVNNQTKGSQIILSRASVKFMTKLFEQEVPEIAEGLVEIAASAREPGGRSKIAVVSRDGDVDPVGACVGMKGSRVQAVVQELRGERIDIVPFNPDPARYVCSALSPAAIAKVIIDENEKSMDVIVPDDQLSLAIGRKGQNVRLAVQLTEWNINIRSEIEMRKMAEWFTRAFEVAPGWGEGEAELLLQSGVTTLEDLATCQDALLSSVAAIDEEGARALRARATELAAQKIEEDAAQKAAAAAAAAAPPVDRAKPLPEKTAPPVDRAEPLAEKEEGTAQEPAPKGEGAGTS